MMQGEEIAPLSLSLYEVRRKGSVQAPRRWFAHLQLLAGEDILRGLCPRGLGCTWGTFWAEDTKDCTRPKARKIPHSYERKLNSRLGRKVAKYRKWFPPASPYLVSLTNFYSTRVFTAR